MTNNELALLIIGFIAAFVSYKVGNLKGYREGSARLRDWATEYIKGIMEEQTEKRLQAFKDGCKKGVAAVDPDHWLVKQNDDAQISA